MEYQLVVSKVDAGIAILQTDDYNVIEFPSLLLPDSVTAGAIVNIKVTRNEDAESERLKSFKQLQKDILELYGNAPTIPAVKCENQWLNGRSLLLSFDFDERGSAIQQVKVLINNSVVSSAWNGRLIKCSSLAVQKYPLLVSIQISTSAGLFESNPITLQKPDPSLPFIGLRIAIVGFPQDNVSDGVITDNNDGPEGHTLTRLSSAVVRMKATLHNSIQFDTTHAVIARQTPEISATAKELDVPLVSADWLYACLDLQKVVDISDYPISLLNTTAESGGSSDYTTNSSYVIVFSIDLPITDLQSQVIITASAKTLKQMKEISTKSSIIE